MTTSPPIHVTRSRLPRLVGAVAITLGRRVYWRGEVMPALVAHELEHVRQWREHGCVRFLALYLGAYVAGRCRGLTHHEAYRAIPFEAAARAAEARHA